MRCEIIAIGTELLLGQHVDTNSAWIGEQLALAGIDSHFQTRVGDNLERIATALRVGLGRSDAVITCGGLGPTQDDITREAIAELLGVSLERNAALVKRIRERFRTRNRPMPDNNLRQADVPLGASPIPQMPGTAPGLICPMGNKVIYAVPGVPSEMKEMLVGTVLPDLRARSGEPGIIVSRTLRTWGQSESGLAEQLAQRIRELDRIGNPTLAFLASGIEGLKVRITVKAQTDSAARAMLDSEEAGLRESLGDLVFGVDTETMESVVLAQLRAAGLSLGVVETVSAGMVTARLGAVPEARSVFQGGIVCLSASAIERLLGRHQGPMVSKETARLLALAARHEFGADIGLATTGVPGAEPVGGHEAGTVFLGIALGSESESVEVRLPGGPDKVRQLSVISLLNLLRLRLLRGRWEGN